MEGSLVCGGESCALAGAADGKVENRRIYHGKSKFFAVFEGLCDMLIIRYWMRMTGFQERNYA
jgi:hypothetical protein